MRSTGYRVQDNDRLWASLFESCSNGMLKKTELKRFILLANAISLNAVEVLILLYLCKVCVSWPWTYKDFKDISLCVL